MHLKANALHCPDRKAIPKTLRTGFSCPTLAVNK
jgi:hypothetical protein